MNHQPPLPKSKIIGHRGASGHAPENTIASFKEAAVHGLHWVEFDIQPCKTGEWMVIHDETVDRTTNGMGAVSELTYQELKSLNAGLWFSENYQHETIPSLVEVIHHLVELNLHPNIEVKGHYQNPQASSFHFAQTLEKHWPKTLALPLISSFNLDFLIALKREAPKLPIGYLIEDWQAADDAFEIIRHHAFFSLHCDHVNFDLSQIAQKNRDSLSQIPLLMYTVNDANIALELFNQGIKALFTDNPLLLHK